MWYTAWESAVEGEKKIRGKSLLHIHFHPMATLILLFPGTLAGGLWGKEMDPREPDMSDFPEKEWGGVQRHW